ncbi:MAG: hypothetical protein RIQ79_1525 [Verrucomicrobiota bacterium]|jgi:hypothetical protein
MSLSPEQAATVSTWIAAGDNLSAVQKKLREQFQISMTYMDVRFLVDDLNLTLKDPAPKADASDVTKAKAAAAPAVPAGSPGAGAEDPLPEEDALPPGPGSVSVDVDGVTLIPGAICSGSVTFSDGVTGKWIVDQTGRPGFTSISQPGYRPTPEDAQVFMRELDAALQRKGL